MKTMNRIFLLVIFLFSHLANAGDGAGKVTEVIAHEGDLLIFKTQTHTNPPSCNYHGWAVSLTTESGKAMLAVLLSAQAQNKDIFVRGKGACIDWTDRETPMYVRVQ